MDWNLMINAALLITTIISTVAAIYFSRKAHQKDVNNSINISQKLVVFLSREAMIKHLHTMYIRAKNTDVIWGQSMSGRHYGDVNAKIMDAASRGVRFRMIFNRNAEKINQIEPIFRSLKSAETICLDDNRIRMQGLSNEEVMIAISDQVNYHGVLIRDEAVVTVLREWFDSRFQAGKDSQIDS